MPAPVVDLVPVVSPTSEISGIYLYLGEARAHGGGIKSWVVIGRPGLEDHMERVRKHYFWHFIPSYWWI